MRCQACCSGTSIVALRLTADSVCHSDTRTAAGHSRQASAPTLRRCGRWRSRPSCCCRRCRASCRCCRRVPAQQQAAATDATHSVGAQLRRKETLIRVLHTFWGYATDLTRGAATDLPGGWPCHAANSTRQGRQRYRNQHQHQESRQAGRQLIRHVCVRALSGVQRFICRVLCVGEGLWVGWQIELGAVPRCQFIHQQCDWRLGSPYRSLRSWGQSEFELCSVSKLQFPKLPNSPPPLVRNGDNQPIPVSQQHTEPVCSQSQPNLLTRSGSGLLHS